MEIEVETKGFFSSDNQYLGIIRSDKKIKVIEVNTKAVYDNKLDDKLISYYTSIAFGQDVSEGVVYAALGTDTGDVKLYDFRQNKILKTLKEHAGNINHLRFNPDNTSIISSSNDKRLIKWDLASYRPSFSYDIEKKSVQSPIKFDITSDDVHVIFNIDNKVNILNTASSKIVKKIKGHVETVDFIQVIPKSTMFMTAANSDSISIWDLEQENSLYSIPIASSIYNHIECKKKGKSTLQILAYNPTQISVWVVDLSDANAATHTSFHAEIPMKEIIAVAFNTKDSLIVALKEKKTEFIIVNLFDEESKQLRSGEDVSTEIKDHLLKTENNSAKSSKAKTNANQDYYVTGETDYAMSNVKPKKNGMAIELPQDTILDHLIVDNSTDKLNLDLGQMDSLAVVLLQALHNDDAQLLEYCLEQEDENVIENTVKKILQSKLMTLLEKIIARLNTYYKKNSNLLVWLKAILKHHASYLIKIPKMADKIAPLVAMFKKRSENFEKIYKLKGKLDMLLKIDEDHSNLKSKNKPVKTEYLPKVVYNEGDTEHIQEEKKPTHAKSAKAQKASNKSPSKKKAQEPEFSDSIEDSDEDINENFDHYLNAAQSINESDDVGGLSDNDDYIDLE
jgi:WD40 repeat protein